MIRLTVIPREGDNLYNLLTRKEIALRKKNQGTLHRSGAKRSGTEKWKHSSYAGWINLQRCVGGTLAAVVQSKAADTEWQLLTSLVGFLDRHFRDHIASITISYDQSEG
jgi:hypothetical protein